MSSSRVFEEHRSVWDYPTLALSFERDFVVPLADEIRVNGLLSQSSRFKCIPLAIGFGLLQVVTAVITLAEMLLRGLGNMFSGMLYLDGSEIFTGIKLIVGGSIQMPIVAMYGIFAATLGTVCVFISPRKCHGLFYSRLD